VKTRLDKAFIDAGLIDAERATALQQQSNTFEVSTAAWPLMLRPSQVAIPTILEANIVRHDEFLSLSP